MGHRSTRKILCPKCSRLKVPKLYAKCGPCKSIWTRAHRLKNIDVYKARKIKWGRENPDKLKAIKRRDYLKHKEKRDAARDLWTINNKDKIRLYAKKTREKRKEKQKIWRRKYLLDKWKKDPLFYSKRYSEYHYGEHWQAHRVLVDLKRALKNKEQSNERSNKENGIKRSKPKASSLGNPSRR